MKDKICQRNISRGFDFIRRGKPAKHECNGKWYCGIHNPNKALTKAQIAADENRKLQAKKLSLEAAARDLFDACEALFCAMDELGYKNAPANGRETMQSALGEKNDKR